MIKLETSGISAFRSALKLEMARLDRDITKVYVGWTTRIFQSLVEKSPQWSGNMAANWNYSLNTPSEAYSQVANKTGFDKRVSYIPGLGVFELGHPNAVSDAMSRMEAVPKGTWRDQVYITNNTPTDDGKGFLVDAIEGGAVKLRPVNLVYAPVMLINQTALVEGQRTAP